MQEAGWYIVQVRAGAEPSMCQAIQRACEGLQARNTVLHDAYGRLRAENVALLRGRNGRDVPGLEEQGLEDAPPMQSSRDAGDSPCGAGSITTPDGPKGREASGPHSQLGSPVAGAANLSSQPDLEELELEGTPLLQECFVPMFVQRLKVHGEWVDLQKPLLPGYLIAVTTDPVNLFYRLRRIKAFARLLQMGEAIVPLREDERAWLEESTKPAERVVPISIAYREGDKLVVTEGPLTGREAMVKRVIRKKCLAQLELHVDGKRVTTTVGLAVMPKQDALEAAATMAADSE